MDYSSAETIAPFTHSRCTQFICSHSMIAKPVTCRNSQLLCTISPLWWADVCPSNSQPCYLSLTLFYRAANQGVHWQDLRALYVIPSKPLYLHFSRKLQTFFSLDIYGCGLVKCHWLIRFTYSFSHTVILWDFFLWTVWKHDKCYQVKHHRCIMGWVSCLKQERCWNWRLLNHPRVLAFSRF